MYSGGHESSVKPISLQTLVMCTDSGDRMCYVTDEGDESEP